jgi:hypothetical protein
VDMRDIHLIRVVGLMMVGLMGLANMTMMGIQSPYHRGGCFCSFDGVHSGIEGDTSTRHDNAQDEDGE